MAGSATSAEQDQYEESIVQILAEEADLAAISLCEFLHEHRIFRTQGDQGETPLGLKTALNLAALLRMEQWMLQGWRHVVPSAWQEAGQHLKAFIRRCAPEGDTLGALAEVPHAYGDYFAAVVAHHAWLADHYVGVPERFFSPEEESEEEVYQSSSSYPGAGWMYWNEIDEQSLVDEATQQNAEERLQSLLRDRIARELVSEIRARTPAPRPRAGS